VARSRRAVAAQHQADAGVHAADVGLHAVEVAGEQQVGAAVAVDVGGEDPVHRASCASAAAGRA
jgi:hypothetical protein